MNLGLIAKTIREVWVATLLYALALLAIEALFAHIIPSFYRELSDEWLELDFVKDMFKGLFGTEVGSLVGPGVIGAISWVHPLVLALILAYEITHCTRLPVGEIDRGTIDVLLGLPVSRMRVYVCESAVWLISGVMILGLGLVGNLVGTWTASSEHQSDLRALIVVVTNLYCLYIAVGGIAYLVSSVCDRRGRAIGIILTVMIISFLLNFLAQFSGFVKSISFLSVLSYYKPLFILREPSWPWADMLVLLAVGVIGWALGAAVFSRRDICTV